MKKTIGTNKDGKKFNAFISLIFKRANPVQAIKNPPMIEISVISAELKKLADKNFATK